MTTPQQSPPSLVDGCRVLRWAVRVDDLDHYLPGVGRIVHVAARPAAPGWFGYEVEFWTINTDPTHDAATRAFRVFGTGHLVPAGYAYIGTAPRTHDGLVWHLFERSTGAQA